MKCTRTCLAVLIALFALTSSAAWAGGAKVQVCHIPPGNPANFHTITISANALQAHLGHGDLAGACFAHCDTLCSDGNACTIDACDASEQCLMAHPPVNCDDSNLCTTDSCNPATGCVSVPKTCADGNNCTVDACDPLTGSCVAPPVACPAGQTCAPDTGSCESGVTCPCTSLPQFNIDLAGMVSCEVMEPGVFYFMQNGSFINHSFVRVDPPTYCGVGSLVGGANVTLPTTPEENAVCFQLVLDSAASHGQTCQ